MRHVTLILSAVLFSVVAAQAQTREKGIIKAVTVYSDRALVSRSMNVTGGDGSGYVIFTDLPERLVSSSVRATVKGALITGVSLQPVVDDRADRFKDHALKKKLDQFDDRIKSASNKLSTHRDQLKLLQSFARLTTQKSDQQSQSGRISTTEWAKALSFIEEKRNSRLEKIRLTEKKIADLRDGRRKVQSEFDRLTRSNKTASVEAKISFADKKSSKAVIELRYMVRSVSWRGFYDVRGSSERSEFNLLAHAIIRQSTGEDWSDAKITLSSAKPSTSTSPGILHPWRVSASSLGKNRPKRETGGKGSGFGSDGDDESSTVDSSETSTFSFELPGRETIKSNNAAHEITLKKSTLKGKVDHVAVPSLSTNVFLRANLNNSSGMPIFVGDINIFLDGNFVGKSRLERRVAAGERFDLFLGPDQRMHIKRTLVKGEVEGSGVFSKKVDVVNKWQIELGIYSGKTRSLVVFDRFPIAADPNITTKFIGSSSKVKANDNGILRWEFKLASKQKQKFDFSYSMSFPREMWNKFVQRDEKRRGRKNDNFMRPQQRMKKRQYNLEEMF